MAKTKTDVAQKWHGLHAWRYERESLEKRIALAWQRFNELSAGPSGAHASALDMMLTVGDQRFPDECSDRDRVVANTVIQWLGSPIGRGFVEESLFSPELKELLTRLRDVSPNDLPPSVREVRKQWLLRDQDNGL